VRNVAEKSFKKIKTHIMCSINISKNCAIHELMWKNMVYPDKPRMSI